MFGIQIDNRESYSEDSDPESSKLSYETKNSQLSLNSLISDTTLYTLYDFNKKYNFDIKDNKIDYLDLNLKNIDNNELKILGKVGFENLKELYLSNNKLTDTKGLEAFKLESLEILDLSYNEITDINNLVEIHFDNLRILNFSKNKLTDISVLQKINLEKLEELDLSYNEISDIDILEKVNFKNIIYLNLFDNNISNIKIEKMNLEKLELLNLGFNNISDINVLEKINFKELKMLYLQINNISNIKLFEKLKFQKLEELNLCENNINEKDNEKIISKLKSEIKRFEINHDKDSNFYSAKYIGMILDVSNDILNNLITFSNEKAFLDNVFCESSGEIMILIKGNFDMPYYDLNELLLSSTNYLKDSLKYNKKMKKELFDEIALSKILKKMNNNSNELLFADFNTVYNNYLGLKKIISKDYSSFNINLFKHFDKYISKSKSLYLPIKNILNNIKKKYLKNKYIVIISDGNTKLSQVEINDIKKISKNNKIMIIIVFLSKNKNIKKYIYNKFPSHLNQNLKFLFDISSKVNYKNPIANYYIKKKWNFSEGGEGKLFFETNLRELNQLYKNLNEIKYEGVDINFGNFNSENFIQFKYKFKFLSKNQIFGTCWANAYSAAIFLTSKRILGRKIKTYEHYREKLIKFGSDINIDGGNIENEGVKKFFKDNNLHFKIIKESEAKKAVMKGRFIIFSFRLNEKQWYNFSNFFKSDKEKKGILSEEILNNECKEEIQPYVGHAVLLIEIKGNYLRFLNSWGSDWGDGGTFKLENPSILKPYNTEELPKFYDIFFYEDELPDEEKKFYLNNIKYIRGLFYDFGKASINEIRDYIKYFPKEFEIICESSGKKGNITKSEPLYSENYPNFYLNTVRVKLDYKDGLYKIDCPFCKNHNIIVEGKLKEFLLFLNLLYDGNEDFDINFKEKYYIEVKRINLHDNFKENLENESDECSLGSENLSEKKITPLFSNEVNSIICLENSLFIASSSNKIVLFELISSIEDKFNIKYIKEEKILNNDLLTLYYFKNKNLIYIAVGGKDLKIFIYEENDLIPKFIFDENTEINKIIAFNDKNEGNKKEGDGEKVNKMAICDKYGYIGIYNIHNDEKEIKFDFKYKCHNSCINCIIYIPEEKYLVSSSSEEKSLIFWEIHEQEKKLIQKKLIDRISSTIYNDNLLNIKNDLLFGEKNCIGAIHHEKNIEMYYYCYNDNDNEFGPVYSINDLGDNYFICGRSFGYCSIFLLRDKTIRNINIFRNNNLSSFNPLDIKNDTFFITHICVNKTFNKDKEKGGFILVSSIDKTLKIYDYTFKENNN